MTERRTSRGSHPPYLQEIILRRQSDGIFNIHRLVTNRGTFEVLEEVRVQTNTEAMTKFVEYVKSLCWADVVKAIQEEDQTKSV